MSKHTPGPWEVYHDGYHDVWSVEGGGDTLCALYFLDEETHRRHPIGEPNAEGNARLIAAAPMLLEACKAAMRIVELWCPSLPRHADDVHEFQALQSMRKKFRAAIALTEQETTQ